MPGWFCKIWQFVANLLGKVVDFILAVVKKLVGFAVELVEGVADALFGGGNLLLLVALGLGAWWLLSGRDDEKREPPANSDPTSVVRTVGYE